MEELNKIRIKSKNITKIIIIEFTFCTLLYFTDKVFFKQSNLINCIYLGLLVVLPLGCNSYMYFWSKKKTDFIEANNLIIVQILVLFYSCKFLIG